MTSLPHQRKESQDSTQTEATPKHLDPKVELCAIPLKASAEVSIDQRLTQDKAALIEVAPRTEKHSFDHFRMNHVLEDLERLIQLRTTATERKQIQKYSTENLSQDPELHLPLKPTLDRHGQTDPLVTPQ